MLGRLLSQILGIGAAGRNLQEGILAYDQGDLDAAERHLAAALRSRPRDATAHRYAGLAARRSGRLREALAHFRRATEIDPRSAEPWRQAAATEYLLDNPGGSWRCCEEALAREPDDYVSHELMSKIALPGTRYNEILTLVHETLQPRTYVEIGVRSGASIALAGPGTRAIGIDPAPCIDVPLSPTTTIQPLTSDDYFATHDVRAELGGLPVDLAFIDGLHLFEQALRDFINLEGLCTPASTILLHDCYPLDRRTAERVPVTLFSSGDVWRVILALKKHRPDLDVHVIATAPTGLGVVRRLDPASATLARDYEGIVAEFMATDYGVLDPDKAGKLNLFPNDPAAIRSLLTR